jgi:hypothetical protein
MAVLNLENNKNEFMYIDNYIKLPINYITLIWYFDFLKRIQ